MALSLPENLELHLDPWDTVVFFGAPMFRAQAWALWDYHYVGGHPLIVNSADRRDAILKKYAPSKKGQQYLFDTYNRLARQYGVAGAQARGFFPANPPSRTSHCLFSDGNPVYRVPAGRSIPKYMLGVDATDRPGGDAAGIVGWLNSHGYHAVRPYNTNSERHHLVLTADPVANARKRLKKYSPRILRPGMYGDDVKQMQVQLKGIHLLPTGHKVGKFYMPGGATYRALRKFKKSRKLPVDGILGHEARKKLRSAYEHRKK